MLLLAAVMLLCVRRTQAAREHAPTTWHTLLAGLRFVWSKPVMLGAMSLDLFAVLFAGATALLPIYASDILHVGPDGLGWLRAAPGVGASICALWLSLYPITRRAGVWILSSVAVFGVATIAFGLTTQFFIAMLALIVIGGSESADRYEVRCSSL